MDNFVIGFLDAMYKIGVVVVSAGKGFLSFINVYDNAVVSNVTKVFNGVLSFLGLPVISNPDIWIYLFGGGMLYFVLALFVVKLIKFFI